MRTSCCFGHQRCLAGNCHWLGCPHCPGCHHSVCIPSDGAFNGSAEIRSDTPTLLLKALSAWSSVRGVLVTVLSSDPGSSQISLSISIIKFPLLLASEKWFTGMPSACCPLRLVSQKTGPEPKESTRNPPGAQGIRKESALYPQGILKEPAPYPQGNRKPNLYNPLRNAGLCITIPGTTAGAPCWRAVLASDSAMSSHWPNLCNPLHNAGLCVTTPGTTTGAPCWRGGFWT